MNTIILIAFCLGVSLLFSEMFRKFKYPRVMGQIIAGVILGIPIIKVLFTAENLGDVSFLSELGIVFLLFLVGLEINLRKLKKSSKDALLIAVFRIRIVEVVAGIPPLAPLLLCTPAYTDYVFHYQRLLCFEHRRCIAEYMHPLMQGLETEMREEKE